MQAFILMHLYGRGLLVSREEREIAHYRDPSITCGYTHAAVNAHITDIIMATHAIEIGTHPLF